MFELRFPSDTKFLLMVRELSRRLSESTGFDAEEAEKIAMAVDEATANVIVHAYHGKQDGEIEIHFDPEGERLGIYILHDGDKLEEVPLPGVDLGKLVAERRKGGLGIDIMRRDPGDFDFRKAGPVESRCVTIRYNRRPTKGG